MSVDRRYLRQVAVPGVGEAGQRALSDARVLCVGAGGLGSPAALYLAAAGVGTLGIVDDDVVDLSNLHRQVLHGTADVGRAKTTSAADTIAALNPEVTVVEHRTRLSPENAAEIVAGYDLVLDGADNVETRYVVSDACLVLGVPHVWAAVLGDGGQLSVFLPDRGPVYRDLYPTPPAPGSVPSCAVGGVLGVVPGILGVAMAAEALKLILGRGEPVSGAVGVYDMLTGEWDRVPLAAHPHVARPRTTADIGAGVHAPVSATELAAALERSAAGGPEVGVLDVRTAQERAEAAIPGSAWLPLDRLEAGEEPEVPEGIELFVHCRSGVRSARAAQVLRGRGWTVHDVAGGIEAWQARGGVTTDG